MTVVLALDAGTTGVRTRAVFDDGTPSFSSYREFTQYFPQPGWVEHDANEIWNAMAHTIADVVQQLPHGRTNCTRHRLARPTHCFHM